MLWVFIVERCCAAQQELQEFSLFFAAGFHKDVLQVCFGCIHADEQILGGFHQVAMPDKCVGKFCFTA